MGTCQICGRNDLQINAKGLISHHGYKRPGGWGFQTASCLGAKELSYEQSSNAIQPVINRVRDHLAVVQAHLESLETPPDELTVYEKYGSYGNGKEVVYHKPQDFDKDCKHNGMMSHSYAGAYDRLARDNKREIDACKGEIKFLTKRLTDWSFNYR